MTILVWPKRGICLAMLLASLSFAGAWAQDEAISLDDILVSADAKAAARIATLTVGEAQEFQDSDAAEEIAVPITLARHGTRPVSMTLGFLFDESKFAFQSAVRGPVAMAAMKDVSGQLREPGNVNFVVASTANTVIEQDGVLFYAVFEVIANNGTAPIALKGKFPSIANDEMESVPVLMLGNCGGPPTPTEVDASQGIPGGVLVEWTFADGASTYVVYRNDVDDPDTAEPVSGWLTAQDYYLDTSAAPGGSLTAGCNGTGDTRTYYYWVRAVNDVRCGSDLGGPAEGYRGGGSGKTMSAGVAPFGHCGDAILIALSLVAFWSSARLARSKRERV